MPAIINVLTTSPSLDVKNNVSGIANLTRLWVENNRFVNYFVFTAGKSDNDVRNLKWFFKQPLILMNFIRFLLIKNIAISHINMPLEKAAIIRDYFFILFSSIFGIPVILHLRGGLFSKNLQTPLFFRFLLKYSFLKAEGIIFLGENEKEFYKKKYNIPENKISVLPNCAKVPCEHSIKENPTTSLNILFMGRLDKNKGLIEIINALQELNSIKYIFNYAGDGPDKDWFIETSKKVLGSKVQYHGVIGDTKKADLLAKSHIFLLPSYFEGLPNALLEAMSYGVVPIVTPVGSIPEVITNDYNGLLVEVGNSSEISKSISKLITNDYILENLRINSIATIRRQYSIDKYLTDMNIIYQDVLKGKDRKRFRTN